MTKLFAFLFSWPHRHQPIPFPPTGAQVLMAFFVYLVAQVFLMPSLLGMYVAPFLLGLFADFILGAHFWEHWPLKRRDRFQEIARGMLFWFIAFPVTAIVVQSIEFVLSFVVEVPTVDQVAVHSLKSTLDRPAVFVAYALAVITAVPVVEEMLFRGFVQSWLRGHVGVWKAIVGTSLLFAGLHFSFSQGLTNIPLLAALCILSILLGVLYERFAALWAPMALHSTFNAISVIMIVRQSMLEMG